MEREVTHPTDLLEAIRTGNNRCIKTTFWVYKVDDNFSSHKQLINILSVNHLYSSPQSPIISNKLFDFVHTTSISS